jgi:hypothetical protein
MDKCSITSFYSMMGVSTIYSLNQANTLEGTKWIYFTSDGQPSFQYTLKFKHSIFSKRFLIFHYMGHNAIHASSNQFV